MYDIAELAEDAVPLSATGAADLAGLADPASTKRQPRIGYACISVPLRELGIYTSRTATLARLKSSPTIAIELARLNLADLERTIIYNEQRGFRFFRITSNLFPHMSSPRYSSPGYEIATFGTELRRIGRLLREYDHRAGMHPGQYVQLGSKRPEVVADAIRDLVHHADILCAMKLEPSHGAVIVIHLGGVFDSREETKLRFIAAFQSIPAYARRFIVIENDELWNADECLEVSAVVGAPVVLDFFHDTLNPCRNLREIFDRVASTWRGIRPKCHWSEQKPGARRGTHSDSISSIPAIVWEFSDLTGADIMLEVKNKDVSVQAMYEKYYSKTVITRRTAAGIHVRTDYERLPLAGME